jgi:hypothetical protein
VRALSVGPAPIEAHLRALVPAAEPSDTVLRRLTDGVLGNTRALRRHTTALNNLIERFPEETRGSLSPDGLAAWQAVLRRHATASVELLDALDGALAPYFAVAPAEPLPVSETLTAAVRRVANEAITIDAAILAVFTTSDSTPGGVSEPLSLDVRRHIARARTDASSIARFIQR